MTLLFVVFYIFSILIANSSVTVKNKERIFAISCLVIAVMVGFRDPSLWSDSAGYEIAFNDFTNKLENFSFLDTPYGYSEFGFYFIGVIIKTFTENSTIYFLIISILTFAFLYRFSDRFCLYPLIALCVYMGRFLAGRNMVQIRAALAIAIILCGTQYITKQKLWKFLAVIAIAYVLHHSALVALPVFFMNKINISKKHIYIGLLVAFALATFYGGTIKSIISNSNFIKDMASTYIQEGSEKAWSNSLENPIIYYQCFVLIVFTVYENRFSKLTEHYYTIRNAYFYSTLLLIVLCQYGIIAGRTSTIFATYEMVIIPMFITLFHKNGRIIPYFGIGLVSAAFFYYNYKPAIAVLINQ